jgi:hypothetical protein
MEAGGNSRTGFGKSCCDEMIAGKDVSEEECLSLFILFTPEFLEHREMAFEALPDGRIAFSDYGNDLAEKRIADVQPLVLRVTAVSPDWKRASSSARGNTRLMSRSLACSAKSAARRRAVAIASSSLSIRCAAGLVRS